MGGVGRSFRFGDVGGVLIVVVVVVDGVVDDDVDVVDVSAIRLSSGQCCRKEDANSPTKAVNSKMRCLGVLN